MESWNGGSFEMKLYNKIEIPDKMFGLESALLVVFIPLIALVLVLVLVFGLVLMPKIEEIQEVTSKITTVQTETKAINDKRKYILSIDQDNLQKNANYVNNALLPEKNSYLLVSIIRKIADKYDFQIDSFQIKLGEIVKKDTPATALEALSKVPVTLRLIGPQAKYLELVSGLEKSLPILSIDNFEMVIANNSVNLDLVISAFYLGNTTKSDINKISLADLTLKQDESDLVTRITNDFTIIQDSSTTITEQKSFVKFDRSDPFNF
jgi:hypothetical protein